MSYTFEIVDLYKTYQYGKKSVEVLSGVNFTLDQEHLCILGPSGSGKSTLLNLLSLLDQPDRGELKIFGTDFSKSSVDKKRQFREKNIGFIFQAFHLISEMTVFQNIALPGNLSGFKNTAKRTSELIERVNLSHVKNMRPHVLSGGERQRVAIARALFHKPRLLFADEPTGNLDAQTGHDVMHLIRETCYENEAQLILVTHNESLVTHNDMVLEIENGKAKQKSHN